MILNLYIYRLSPQYYIIYNNYFETVPHDTENPSPNWKEFCIGNFLKIDIELDNEDNNYFENGWEILTDDLDPSYPILNNLSHTQQREPPSRDFSSQSQ